MNPKPYKIIFSLILLSILAILVLQGFWISSFYTQKQEDFSGKVYAALEQVAIKLKERQGLRVIRQQFSAHRPENAPRGSGTFTSNIFIQVGTGKRVQSVTGGITKEIRRQAGQLKSTDSVIRIFEDGQTIVTKKELNGTGVSEKEMNQLMEKIVTEIRVAEEEKNSDTLKALITRVLNSKGLFTPFEFALKNLEKNQLLSSSPGFKEDVSTFSYDLSSHNVFSTHNFLFLQFPAQSGFVLSSMREMLLLSLVLSLLLSGSLYYTIRLIRNQKRLSEIRNDFVNNMTHELKTPIATNALAIDAIADPRVKNDDDSFSDYIRILKEENKKLNSHVERVLQMALLDKGELPLNKSRLDIVKVIREAIDHHKLQILGQKALIRFEPSKKEVFMIGDAQHLFTMLSNLIDNALKYSVENCTIDIGLTQNEQEIEIAVKDNGIGIDKEHRDKVFDKFYRVQGGNLHDVKGFGLGLSYVKSIAEAHAGAIVLNSEYSQGSEFVIMFRADV